MALLVRILRFYNNQDSLWWPLAWLAMWAFIFWRHAPSPAAFLGGTVVLFAAPYYVRHMLIRRYRLVMRTINQGTWVALGCYIALSATGERVLGSLIFALYGAFLLGSLFWCASDEMFEMASWLAFPTEWGRWPDDIVQVDCRAVPWPDDPVPRRTWLFKFRYDQEWFYGITGPITFAFNDNFDGKSHDEIYAAYTGWYDREGVGKMIQEYTEQDGTAPDPPAAD